jgi:hypothetical protein
MQNPRLSALVTVAKHIVEQLEQFAEQPRKRKTEVAEFEEFEEQPRKKMAVTRSGRSTTRLVLKPGDREEVQALLPRPF